MAEIRSLMLVAWYTDKNNILNYVKSLGPGLQEISTCTGLIIVPLRAVPRIRRVEPEPRTLAS
jgi:hypothetical protein